jgi:hypothetical protein
MDIDVKKIMLTLLERQKEYVLEDRENYGEAMVAVFLADNQSHVTFPAYEDEEGKIAAYSAIVRKAKEDGAVLIITVNSARTKKDPPEAELENYRWGDFGPSDSQSCILLTASGPSLRSCSLQLGYAIRGTNVEFDLEPEFSYGIELTLLPDWPAREAHGSA